MAEEEITRWNKWFGEENLRKDPRILAAPPSHTCGRAAQIFLATGKHRVLDLACGVGRDSLQLAKQGLTVTGADASFNGIRLAQKRAREQGIPLTPVMGDARCLPFSSEAFEGVYCFGLLHEFTGEEKQADIAAVMAEIRRILRPGGLLVLTVTAGNPEAGLPKVQLFTREMFKEATRDLRQVETSQFNDIGCTGREDYTIWYGLFEKSPGNKNSPATG